MTTITFNGLAGDLVAFITITTAFVCIVLGAYVAWQWIVFELFVKAVLSAKVWHRFRQFIWYYNRGLKEKLDELDSEKSSPNI